MPLLNETTDTQVMDLSMVQWRSMIKWISVLLWKLTSDFRWQAGYTATCCAGCYMIHWLVHSFFQDHNKLKHFIRCVTNLHWNTSKWPSLYSNPPTRCYSTLGHWGAQFSTLQVSWKVDWPGRTNSLAYPLKVIMCNSQIRTVWPIIIMITAISHDISMHLWEVWNLHILCLLAI